MALGAVSASALMHKNMLERVLRSPMSFFDTTPMGRIVNRFAKDIYMLDETIPASLRSFLSTFMQVTWAAGVSGFVVQ
jgi:ABC-type multidrug transport system fused ATPase/permease subunit